MMEDKNNIVDTNNQNVSLNENTCLEAIPYEVALHQNGWAK
ncbi:hypothetical protein ABID23_000375 [Bartonella silvatica]|uniref:Uncharacterized protein n=1 Tax=Bartonella silvatica TaxID=357760 RepID=A0ABV2HFH8_9HYPH